MRFIGITGGVGAGKSTVLTYLRDHYNCRVVLADELAHELMEQGGACWEELCELLGSQDVWAEAGELDRQRLARLLFMDDTLRERLNGIVHPAVKANIMQQAQDLRESGAVDYLFFEAALLIEEGYDKICDELWYIYASEDVRRARLRETRGYLDEKITAIFASQMSEEAFRRACQHVIDNSGDEAQTQEQVRKLLGE